MKKGTFLLLIVCLFLTGCSELPRAREMGDMALLRTMGIDAAPSGVAVTGSTGPRAKGLQAEGEPALTLSADRESLSGACLAMQGQSDSYVFFGYVDQLLIGEELAKKGVQSVLDYFARDVELGLGAQLWLVRNATAREAVTAGGEEGVDRRLETLQSDSKIGIAAITRTAGEVYTDLLELGSTYVPALSLAGDETAILIERGYGIIKEDALVGFLDGEGAKGLELLTGGTPADVLETELTEQLISVKITSACTKSKLEFQENVPSALKLTCNVEGRLSEYRQRPDRKELEELTAALEQQERIRLEEALTQLRALKADCVGLGVKAAMLHPARWQEIKKDWPEVFSQVPIELRVELKIVD